MKIRDGKGVSAQWFMEKVAVNGGPVRNRQ